MRIPRPWSALLLALLALLFSLPARAAYPVVSTLTVAGSGGGTDAIKGMAQDASGNLYVAGYLVQAGGSDIWVAKYSPALVLLSSYTYDRAGFEDLAWAISVDTESGGVFVAGSVSTANVTSSYDIWLAKFDSNLALLSTVTINGSAGDRDEAQGVRVVNGSVYVVGRSSVAGGPVHWVSRYDMNLVLLSSSSFAQYDPYSTDILPVSSSSLFVAGARGPNGTTSPNAWIGKYDSSLVRIASAAVNGPGANIDDFIRLAADGSGGAYTVGYLDTATASDRFIVHYDANLVTISSSVSNGPGNAIDYLSDVLITSSGTLIVSGGISETAGNGSMNAFIAEYTAGLALISSTAYRSSGTGADHASSIVMGTNNDLYVAGWVTESNQDAWIARFSTASTSAAFPGCSLTDNVGSGQTYATIQAAVNALPSTLTGPSCVVIRDGATYAEQVTVQSFTNNGFTISILADPGSGLTPKVAPPTASTAAFHIANASVSVAGVNIVPTNSVQYGIFVSSAYASISSVNVVDAGGKIWTAGVATSSNAAVSYSSVTVSGAHGLMIAGGWNTISRSTISSNGAGNYALLINGAAYNTITQSLLSNAAGFGAHLPAGANYNTISQSTITSNGASSRALNLVGASSNTITQSYIASSAGHGMYLNTSSDFNTISQNTILSGAGGFSALAIQSSDANSVTGCSISNPAGNGAFILSGADFNTISLSTMTGQAGGGFYALLIQTSSSNTISSSYIQGSTAAFINASTGTVINASVLVATNTTGSALALIGGSNGLTLNDSTLSGGPTGRTLALAAGNNGTLSIASVTLTGAARGIELSTQAAGFVLAVDTVTFKGLAAGATAVHFLGGTFVATFTAASFDATAAVNVNASPLGAASRVTMSAYSGARGGPIYENDPGSLVEWLTIPPPAAPSGFSGAAQTTASVLWTWTDNAFDELGLRVMAGPTNISGDLAANATSWLQTGLGVNTSSGSLLVQVFNSTGTSNSVSATRYSLAVAPASLAASGIGLGAAKTSWTSGGNPVGTLYELERSTGTGFGLRQSSAAFTFADPMLAPASTYYYRVRALNGDIIAAAYSSTIAVVSLPVPVYPTPASVSISSAETGAIVAEGVVGAGFTASAVLTFERHAVDSGVWTATGSFAQARHSSTMMKLRDGRALLVGGLIEGQTGGRPEVDVYDLTTGNWTAAAPLNVGRFQHADVMLADGRVLVTGGQAPDAGVVSSAEIYDPASSTWTVVASMAQIRKGHRMALLPDGRVLAVGGYTGAASLLTAEIYDPLLNSWSGAASMSVVRAFPTLTMLGNGKALVAGGRDPTLTSASAQLYNHLLNSWTETGPMSVSRSDHEAVVLPDGRVLIAGGLDPGTEANTADIYDPVTSTWTATGLMAQKRRSLALALANGAPVAIGGQNATTDFASTDIYDSTSNVWRAGPALTNTRTIATAVTLDDGRLLVAGGRRGLGGGTTLNTAERLNSPSVTLAATGVSVPDALNVNGTVNLTGAATGYWDVVVRSLSGRVGRLNGGFAVLAMSTPVAPSGFAGTALSGSSILWNWTDNGFNEAGFRVMAGATNVSGDLAANTTFWLQSGLSVNTSSGALVARAFNAAGTNDSGAATRYSLAAVPTGLASSSVFLTSVTVTWTAGNPAGTVFELERSTGAVFALATSTTEASYTNIGLGAAATYYYRLRALNGDGVASSYASTITIVTLPLAAPNAPTGFAGTAQTTTSILWTWTDNAADEQGFRIMAGPANISGDLAANSSTWLQTGLAVNTSSGPLLVQVFNGTGTTNSASLTRYSLAAAPSGLGSSNVFQTSATLTWTAGNPAGTVFELERSSGTGFGLRVASTSASYTDTALTVSSTYYYRVRTRNADGVATEYTSSITFVTAPPPDPFTPTGFAGAAQSTSTILWSWTDNSTNETGYRVLAGTISQSGNLAADATTWLQSGLTANTSYGLYIAQAFNAGGTANSGTASRTTLAAVPAALAASGVYQTSATISWNAEGNPAGTIFALERSTGTGYGLQFTGAATSYFEQYLTPGATHYFRVRAVNGEGASTANTSTIAVVALPAPPIPGASGTPVGTALGVSSVSWTWALAAGATNHFLFRPSDNSYIGSSSTGPFIQTALTPNTAYGLRAAGVNLGGLGALSPSASVYTLAAVPSGGAVASITSTTVVASWGLNGNAAATAAQLQRSTDAAAYSALASGVLTSYADADLIGCTTYYYRVRNVNGDGFATLYSSFSGVTANTVPGPPSGLSASANAGGTVGLAWGLSPTEGVTGYRLYWDAGTGTVSYGAPIAVLASTQTGFTTGVLTSSAAYTFALRAAHRCGLVETTGALAMSGAAVTLPAVRAVIKEPDSGRRVNGNSVTILAELTSGTPADVQRIAFQYKLAADTTWLDMSAVYLDNPNPDYLFPYFTHVNVTGMAAGSYDLRAVAYDHNGAPDPAPAAVRVAVDHISPDISESVTVNGDVQKDQIVSNTVTSVVETAGGGADDPAVRVTIPPGIVNSATATVSVIANPTITTAAPSGQTFVGSSIKIDLSNGQTALNGTAEIALTYPDTVRFPSLLQIYYLDEATGQWSRDFATTVDTSCRTVRGNTPHFSTFVLMLGTAFAADLDRVQVYPVPFKPNGPNPIEGRPFTSGNPNSGIIFANLAAGSQIKVYTLTGRLVSNLDNPTIAGGVRWDARNQDGRDVASGAYFAVITAPGHKAVVKKLVIIR